MSVPELRKTYYENGSIWEKRWYLNDKTHREDGPASIGYQEDGSIEYQCWYLNGKRLRVRTLKGLQKKVREMIVKEVHAA